MQTFEHEDWDGQGDPWEFLDSATTWSDYEEIYQNALHAEPAFWPFSKPIVRKMEEWIRFETPMTQDDVLECMLFIRRLP